ncbi:MAG: radical SAM protein [Proteobacteria bacterium]|nr:radical SAM protein [Pseudomonadota bacterium]
MERDGNKIEIFDLVKCDQNEIHKLRNSDFDIVGISATSFSFTRAADILKEIKLTNKNIVTIMGGPHTTIALGDVLQCEYIDYAIYGEGEITIAELVKLLEHQPDLNQKQLASIPGLIFRSQKGDVVVNPPRPWITDLDILPFPAFHLFKNTKYYRSYPILTSRGCPYHCIYCAAGTIWGHKWRSRSAINIIEEIEYAKKKYNWHENNFGIIDDSFNVSVPRAHEFCELLINKQINIKWGCQGIRADNMPLELAKKMKLAGCYGVTIGIESADPQVLKNIKKGETIEQISTGIKNLSTAGIIVGASFMIGNPGDTLETIRKSIEFVQKSPLFGVSFNTARPYPKTELWDFVTDQGHFLEDDYTKFHHFSQEPSFETADFTREERIKANELARKFERAHEFKNYMSERMIRLKWKELAECSVIGKAELIYKSVHFLYGVIKNKRHKF